MDHQKPFVVRIEPLREGTDSSNPWLEKKKRWEDEGWRRGNPGKSIGEKGKKYEVEI